MQLRKEVREDISAGSIGQLLAVLLGLDPDNPVPFVAVVMAPDADDICRIRISTNISDDDEAVSTILVHAAGHFITGGAHCT